MNLDIKKILPVPDKKNNLKNHWDSVEKEMGFKFPKDYKEFIDTYGAGIINDFIAIYSPFCENENLNLLKLFEEIKEAYNTMKEKFPKYFELEFFDGEKGLFPWGCTAYGDDLYWNIKEEGITLIIYDNEYYENVEYSMSMTEFLCRVLNKTLVCLFLPEDIVLENNYYKYVNN